MSFLTKLRHGLDEIENICDPTAGLVSVGVSPAQSLFVSGVVERISRRYPKIKFNVVMSDPLRLIRALRDRELDMAICRAQMADGEPDLKAEILFVTGLKSSSRQAIRSLGGDGLHCLISWASAGRSPSPTCSRRLVRKAFRAQSLPMPEAVVSTASMQLRFELMETGGFVTLASRSMAIHPSRKDRMRALPVAFHDDAGPMSAITLNGRQLTKVSVLVLEEARTIAKSIAIAE